MRSKFAIYILLCITGCLVINSVVFGQSNRQLKQAIARSLASEKLTGAVWTIVESDGSIRTASAGIKNNDSKELLLPTDRVHVGSIAKTVLAAGILHLATTGKLNIDDPVKKYLPAVNFINTWEATNPITIRHLLDHTSGLSDVRLWHVFSTRAAPKAPLSDFYAKDPSVLTIQARPGSIYSYSSMGYTLLGMVVESVTRHRYEVYMAEKVLKPLGMFNSTFEFTTQTGEFAVKDLAMGHLDEGQTSPAWPVFVRPAGQFTTTARDMGVFMKFMMSDGMLDGQEFIRESLLAELGKAHLTDASKYGLPGGYGLGASHRDRHGVRGIVHPGVILGFHAIIYMFPAAQKAFFISHNMESEKANYEVFNKIFINHLGLPAQIPDRALPVKRSLVDWNGYYVPAINKVDPFAFLDYVLGHTKVTVTSTGAVLEVFQSEPVLLAYAGEQLFTLGDRTAPSHAFYSADGNQLFISTGLRTLKKVSGFQILLATISVLGGVMGLFYLLVSGTWQIFKAKIRWKQPVIWCSSAICLMIFSIPFITSQPFTSLGDLTIGSFLLASGTALLPFLTTFSIYKYWRTGLGSLPSKANLVSLVLLLQLLVVLFFNDLIPFILWK